MALTIDSLQNRQDYFFFLPEEMRQYSLAFLSFKDLYNFFRAVPYVARNHKYQLIDLLISFDTKAISDALFAAGRVNKLNILEIIFKNKAKKIDPITRDEVLSRLTLSARDQAPSQLFLGLSSRGYEALIKAFMDCAQFNKITLGDLYEALRDSGCNGHEAVFKTILSCSQFDQIDAEHSQWDGKGHLRWALAESIQNGHTTIANAIIDSLLFKKMHGDDVKWQELTGNNRETILHTMKVALVLKQNIPHIDKLASIIEPYVRSPNVVEIGTYAYPHDLISLLHYHLIIRTTLLGISLLFLAKSIGIFIEKIFVGSLLSFIASKTEAECFLASQNKKQTATKLISWKCFTSIVAPKELLPIYNLLPKYSLIPSDSPGNQFDLYDYRFKSKEPL